jgi:ribonuclease P protein component
MRDRSELTLRKQSDFTRVYKKGKSKGSSYVVILYRKNGLDYTRTAFVASKKVGNSVERNRSRRLMREAYRSIREKVTNGYDIVFVARAAINGRTESEVEKCIRSAMYGCGLIEKRH